MEELPAQVLRSSIAFLAGSVSGLTLALVLIGSVDDASEYPGAAMLTYAVLAAAMVASMCGFMIPMDLVAEKWRDFLNSHVTQRSIRFICRVLREAKAMTVLGVVLTLGNMFLGVFELSRDLITELGVLIAFLSEISTFSTAISAIVVVFLQVQALEHWDGSMRPVWLAMLVLMVFALWNILSRVGKVANAFIAACLACFYASLLALMIILTPVLISMHCLSGWLVMAVGSATVVTLQGGVGPAAVTIPYILLSLSQADTKLSHGFWFLAFLFAANSNVYSMDLNPKSVESLLYIRKLALLFGVPVIIAISSVVAVQILISRVPNNGGRLLAWAGKGAALGSAIALRMFGETLISYGLVSFMFVWITCLCFFHNAQNLHVSQLKGMHIATFVIGCGVALFPNHWGLVMTGLVLYTAIKTLKLLLALEEEDEDITTLPGRDKIINQEEYGFE
ncbi:uncharacterized protein LOC103024247 [Astyanax mexicanus]|uniref:uncharacterized protein LOC103024247 n=1 Tax=Astyanax mexicanus TaxID=7994 RepID=UPI0020CB29B4|nr:uncharacterized protein LOC103024247 [Astyanax mexicanus]